MLSSRNKYALAVDASRSRLYMFEHQPAGLALMADFYISVGKAGMGKEAEGDLRTPMGVYYITNSIAPKLLKDFYGAGALPINYPNPLDLRRGKTGSGIWLHGHAALPVCATTQGIRRLRGVGQSGSGIHP
jgi:murein L,D-transpeptidase YafK